CFPGAAEMALPSLSFKPGMVGKSCQGFPESRRHFFFAAARAMRDILVEQARRKASPKRGGRHQRVELDENIVAVEPPSEDMLALHEALADLEKEDPLKAQIVNLRYFAGMKVAATAQVLGISPRTLHRHWRFIKAWLKSRLASAEPTPRLGHGACCRSR